MLNGTFHYCVNDICITYKNFAYLYLLHILTVLNPISKYVVVIHTIILYYGTIIDIIDYCTCIYSKPLSSKYVY